MKESVKITVIAAGFREVGKKQQQRPSLYAQDLEGGRRPEPEPVQAEDRAGRRGGHASDSSGVAGHSGIGSDALDLDVPTFLRRQAQKA